MSDEIIVMNQGRIAQIAAPTELYRHPGSRFVAEFLGPANVLPGKITDVRASEMEVLLPSLAGTPRLLAQRRPGQSASVGDVVDVIIRPENIRIEHQAAPNSFETRIIKKEFLGSRTEITAVSNEARLKFDLVGYLDTADGDRAVLAVSPENITVIAAAAHDATSQGARHEHAEL
jgi:iron(III) transport system ATP-binding protein